MKSIQKIYLILRTSTITANLIRVQMMLTHCSLRRRIMWALLLCLLHTQHQLIDLIIWMVATLNLLLLLQKLIEQLLTRGFTRRAACAPTKSTTATTHTTIQSTIASSICLHRLKSLKNAAMISGNHTCRWLLLLLDCLLCRMLLLLIMWTGSQPTTSTSQLEQGFQLG